MRINIILAGNNVSSESKVQYEDHVMIRYALPLCKADTVTAL